METRPDQRSAGTAVLGAAVPPAQALGLTLATVEGLVGRRALHQLRPSMTMAAFRQLASVVESGVLHHSTLGRLRLQMPSAVAVEASARLSLDQRWIACTIRLDYTTQWLCSDLAILGLPRR